MLSQQVPPSRDSLALEAQESAPNKAAAAHQLGLLLQKGEGRSIDHGKAIEYLEKAIQWGNREALDDAYQIGTQYSHEGAEELAVRYLSLAANHGHADAATEAGHIYEDGTKPFGSVNKLELAIKLYEIGAQESGHNKAYAAEKLGLHYNWGIVVSQDHDKALEYLEKAIRWGSQEALSNANIIGYGYFTSPKSREDLLLALRYLELAANNGCSDAATLVGRMYLEGKVVDKDLKKAQLFFVYGMQEPDKYRVYAAYSAHQLGLMYHKGNGVNVDRKQALKFLEKAVNLGEEDAMLDLVAYYRTQGKLDEAQQLETRYKEWKLNHDGPLLASTGGTLLTIASNLSLLEESYRLLDPLAAEILEKERRSMISQLHAENVLPLSENIPFRLSEGGVCQGMIMDFISRFFAAPSSSLKSTLMSIAPSFECRSGITAVALHSIYEEVADRVKAKTLPLKRVYKQITPILENVDPIIATVTATCERDYTAASPIFKARGQQEIRLVELGCPGELSEREYLSLWLKEPDGIYTMGLFSPAHNGRHVVTLIKDSKANEIFIWDPSIGLVECSKSDPVGTVVGFLAMVYRTTSHCSKHYLDLSRIVQIEATP
jgi:hypothetical protein